MRMVCRMVGWSTQIHPAVNLTTTTKRMEQQLGTSQLPNRRKMVNPSSWKLSLIRKCSLWIQRMNWLVFRKESMRRRHRVNLTIGLWLDMHKGLIKNHKKSVSQNLNRSPKVSSIHMKTLRDGRMFQSPIRPRNSSHNLGVWNYSSCVISCRLGESSPDLSSKDSNQILGKCSKRILSKLRSPSLRGKGIQM